MNKEVEFIKSKNFYAVGVFKHIKSRNKIDKILNKIDTIFTNGEFKTFPKIIEIYEKEYKSNNLNVFIGRIIPKKFIPVYDNLSSKQKKKIIMINDNKIENVLHIKVQNDLKSSYNKLISYAIKDKIQIRGAFKEIYNKDKIDLYVESYDLKIENKDTIKYYSNKARNLKNVYPTEFVGKWKLRGEIIEPIKYFNPRKKHHISNTHLSTIILNSNGSTNIKNITWKENYLIVNNQGVIIYNKMYIEKKLFRKYLFLLVNKKESNSRPYLYFYKK